MKFRFRGFFLQGILLLLISMNSFAIDIRSIGVPYVQNYSKMLYKSGNQNWSVAKDKNGIMYFGNSEGLLTFDGTYWQQYQMPNNLIVRAVAAGGSDKIYTGGFGEFGFWNYNDKGKFVYSSLTHLIPKQFELKDEIWKIYTEKDRVIFQSFASIFVYEGNRISVIKAANPFLFLLKAGSRYFVEIISEGLFELRGKSLVRIANSEMLGNSGILSVLPFDKNSFLIGTARKGLFLYDGVTIRPFPSAANSFLKTYQLNNGSAINGKYFAFGTILNGVVIIDREGNVVQQINKSLGLQNNTVLSLFTDNKFNLWLGLDNGIDRIELNSPLYFYLDRTGKFGTVYSSIIYKGKIYLGTNQGLFYSRWSSSGGFSPFNFQLIEGSQGQVWDLSLKDDKLLCGHNEGTFLVEDASIRKISDVNGGWTIKRLSSDPELLIQGTYTGLVLFKKDNEGRWTFRNKIAGFDEPSRYVVEGANGDIWVSNAYKGVYKIKLDRSLSKVTSLKSYSRKDGLPTNYNVSLFNLENRLLFSTTKGFYSYDNITDQFHPFEQLNSKLGSFAYSGKIIKASGSKYWFIKAGEVTLVDLQPGHIKVDSVSFSALNGRMLEQYENISRINESIYLISVDDGFVIYNESKNQVLKHLPHVLIRRIENIADTVTVLSEYGNKNQDIELPYTKNSIRISYSLPHYRKGTVQYQYLLEGYSRQWSEWSTESQKDFTNLSSGNYTFQVRAKVNNTVSDIARFRFSILKPWYLTKWALLCYLIAGVGLSLVLRRLYQIKLAKDQHRIKQRLQKEKEEELKREAIANEQKIIQIRNEQLQIELAGKNRELSNSAMNLVYKNELLEKIRQELHGLKDSSGKKLPPEQLRKIDKVLNEASDDERDWNLFEKSFNEAHENFFKKLKVDHKDLVPNDLKLCAYLRMNMNSKEIASLLNISLRGVEIRRYRLRKKLNVPHDKNLTEFLLEF